MTETYPGPGHKPGNGPGIRPAARHSMRPSPRVERAVVLGGFAVAALWTAASLTFGTGAEAIGPLWVAAVAWTVPSSLALALRRGLHRRDRSAFRHYELPDNGELVDWTTQSGEHAYVPIAEEHERLMRGD